jgi:hypothetical protein
MVRLQVSGDYHNIGTATLQAAVQFGLQVGAYWFKFKFK